MACIIALFVLSGHPFLGDASGSSALAAHPDATVPSDAVEISAQEQLDRLPSNANAVLKADLDTLTLNGAVNLFGKGHSVGLLILAAPNARVSGVSAGAIVVRAADCVVDHCTVSAQGMNGIFVDVANGARVMDNVVGGCQIKECYGIHVNSADNVVVSGNRVTGAYYGIYLEDCANPLVSDNYLGHATGFQQGLDLYAEDITGGAFRNNEVEFDPYHGTGSTQDHDAIGFRRMDGVLIEDNRAAGHYYTLKIYDSKKCVIQNNTLLRAGSLRTGFYDSNLIVRNNKIQGQVGTQSIGIWINDGVVDSLYENNEIWDCQYGVQESHYPEGYAYLEGGPSLPCRNITLKNNYIHDCSGSSLHVMDKGSVIEVGDNQAPFVTPVPTVGPSPGATLTPTPVVTQSPATTPTPTPTPGPEATVRTQSRGLLDSIFGFFDSIIKLVFH